MSKFNVTIDFNSLHERVGDTDGNVEIGQVALVLGVYEIFDVGMITTHHAHLCTTATTCRFHGLTGAVEYAHVGNRAGGARLGAFDMGTERADGGKIVANAAAATHGLGRLQQGGINTGTTVNDFRNGIAHRLHEAVNQSRT